MGERRAALVTGSTSGIGLGIATAFAKAGMDVTLNGLGDAAEIEKIRSGLERDAGVTVRYDGANLMQAEGCAITTIEGLAPEGKHWTYMDARNVEPEAQAGPSSAAAISLITGMVCTEVLVALLKRRPLMAAPQYSQFDAYLGEYRRGRLRWGNRGPIQRIKLWLARKKFAAMAKDFNEAGFQLLPTADDTPQ